jgi:hypothetical protein
MHELALIGLQAHFTSNTGSFNALGNYVAKPDSASELDFEQDIVGAIQITSHAQAAFLLPWLETMRKESGISELGGGIGDINLGGRYDFTFARDSAYLPGIAALAGITLPTGRAPDQAKNQLTTDATGIGAVQASLGIALEHLVDNHLLLNLTGVLSQRFPRTANGVSETLGLQFAGSFAAGYVLDSGASVALIAHLEQERHAIIDGTVAPGTARRSTSLSLSGSLPLGSQWRAQAALVSFLPVAGLGMNQTAGLGMTLTVIMAWI